MAADSFVGEALRPSPYSELRAKYEALWGWYQDEIARESHGYRQYAAELKALRTKYEELRAWTDVAVELAGFEELSAAYLVLRTKHDRTP